MRLQLGELHAQLGAMLLMRFFVEGHEFQGVVLALQRIHLSLQSVVLVLQIVKA